ncbi:MAG: GNAT family N-acetyltransferase [Bacillus sp. (in: Bacteria)]|nr:GNAT family N-acetyltransferase [Bacillus sp. (in: firmicutes)]
MGMTHPVQRNMKNGETYLIRTANRDDGLAMFELTKEVLKEEKGLVMTLHDFTMTPEDQIKKNEIYLEHPQTLCIIAEHHSNIVGILTLEPDFLLKTMHRGSLGIIVKHGYRGSGIGKQMMTNALNWATTHSTYEKIELEVLEKKHWGH